MISTSRAETVTNNMTVSANIPEACEIQNVTDIAFGDYDPASNKDAQGSVRVRCNPGTTYNLLLDQGQQSDRTMAYQGGSAVYLSYELYRDSARSTTWLSTVDAGNNEFTATTGAPVDHTVYGRIQSGQTGKAAGAYQDTVVVTVDFN